MREGREMENLLPQDYDRHRHLHAGGGEEAPGRAWHRQLSTGPPCVALRGLSRPERRSESRRGPGSRRGCPCELWEETGDG